MKWLLIITLLTSSYTSFSQDSCSAIVSDVDRITGKQSWSAKEKIIVSADKNRQGISFYIIKHTDHPYIIMVLTGAADKFRCVDKGDKINILFRDGTKLEMVNQGNSNCEGRFSLYFGDVFQKIDELNQLITKPVEAVRMWGRGEFIEENFTTKNASDLMHVLSCLKSKW